MRLSGVILPPHPVLSFVDAFPLTARLAARSTIGPERSTWSVTGKDRMERAYQQANAASRQRLRNLVARLDEETLGKSIDGDWTVGAVLAHLAFWDLSCVWRWDEFDRTGAFPSLSGEVVELINTSSLPAWRALPGTVAAEQAVAAAEEADSRVAGLSDGALQYVSHTGRVFILERFSHRNEHLDEIEALLAG